MRFTLDSLKRHSSFSPKSYMVGEEQVAPFVRSPRPIVEECQGDAFLKHLREPGAREAGAGMNLKMLTLEWGRLLGTFENN